MPKEISAQNNDTARSNVCIAPGGVEKKPNLEELFIEVITDT
jgi:hypothetical protein